MSVELKGMNTSRERPAATFNGYAMLAVGLLLSAATVWRFIAFVQQAKLDLPAGVTWRLRASCCCWRFSRCRAST